MVPKTSPSAHTTLPLNKRESLKSLTFHERNPKTSGNSQFTNSTLAYNRLPKTSPVQPRPFPSRSYFHHQQGQLGLTLGGVAVEEGGQETRGRCGVERGVPDCLLGSPTSRTLAATHQPGSLGHMAESMRTQYPCCSGQRARPHC